MPRPPLDLPVLFDDQTAFGQRVVPRLLIGGAERAEHRVAQDEQTGSSQKHSPPVGQRRLPAHGERLVMQVAEMWTRRRGHIRARWELVCIEDVVWRVRGRIPVR